MKTISRACVAGLCVVTVLMGLPSGVCAQVAAPAPAQATLPATAVLAGRVLDAGGNTPVAHAVVTVTGGGGIRRAKVDAQGRFVFTRMPAGPVTIGVIARGYLPGAFGQQRPEGASRPLTLEQDERMQDATIRLWPSASISGTVTDEVGEAMGATVQVWRRAVSAGHWRLVYTGHTGVTDARGRYRISGLPPGEYALVITSMTSSLPSALLTMAAGARTMDEASRAEFSRVAGTNGTFGYVSDLSQGFPTTRVGDVLLQGGTGPTALDGTSVDVFPTTWYPSAPTPAGAVIITLAAGEQRLAADLTMTLTRIRRITGTVMGPDGPMAWLQLRLIPSALGDIGAEVSTSLSQSFNTAMAATDGNGAFTILGVPPGDYILRALTTPRPIPEPPAPATAIRTADGMTQNVQAAGPRLPPLLSREPAFWTQTPVSVGDRDVTDLLVMMNPGVRLHGRVVFEGAAQQPAGDALRAIRVSLEPADGRMVWYPTSYQAQIDAAGEFYSSGLTAGRYLVRVDTPPPGWTLKSAMVGGRDVSDVPVVLDDSDVQGLVLTFTDTPSVVRGTVRDAQGAPDDDAAVVVFPKQGPWTNLGSRPRRVRLIRPGRAGTFSIAGLPPGTYAVVAVSDAEVTHWQDPAFLSAMARVASEVTVVDKNSVTIDLVTAVVR